MQKSLKCDRWQVNRLIVLVSGISDFTRIPFQWVTCPAMLLIYGSQWQAFQTLASKWCLNTSSTCHITTVLAYYLQIISFQPSGRKLYGWTVCLRFCWLFPDKDMKFRPLAPNLVGLITAISWIRGTHVRKLNSVQSAAASSKNMFIFQFLSICFHKGSPHVLMPTLLYSWKCRKMYLRRKGRLAVAFLMQLPCLGCSTVWDASAVQMGSGRGCALILCDSCTSHG